MPPTVAPCRSERVPVADTDLSTVSRPVVAGAPLWCRSSTTRMFLPARVCDPRSVRCRRQTVISSPPRRVDGPSHRSDRSATRLLCVECDIAWVLRGQNPPGVAQGLRATLAGEHVAAGSPGTRCPNRDQREDRWSNVWVRRRDLWLWLSWLLRWCLAGCGARWAGIPGVGGLRGRCGFGLGRV